MAIREDITNETGSIGWIKDENSLTYRSQKLGRNTVRVSNITRTI